MNTIFHRDPENSETCQNGHNVSDEDYTVEQVEAEPPSWEEDN